jgi:hypothetical protein
MGNKIFVVIFTFILFIIVNHNSYCDAKTMNKLTKKYLSELQIECEEIKKEEIKDFNKILDAVDKTIALKQIFNNYLEENDKLYIKEKVNFLHDFMGSFSTIYFGYSKDGIRFVAIAQATMSHNYDFSDLVNKISNSSQEADFINHLAFIEPKGYYAIDIYTEDLFNKRKNIEIDLSVKDNKDIFQSPLTEIKDDGFDNYLKKYNREMCKTKDIELNKWNLFVFNERIGWPLIKINYNGEEIILMGH